MATSPRAIATTALVAAALTFVVIVASAFMRHSQSGLACADWPSCYARAGGIDARGVPLARSIHRVAATGVALAALLLFALSWRALCTARGRWTVAALALVAGLATLGVATPGARVPAVALANLLGGLLLLATLAAVHASAARSLATMSRPLHALAVAALVLALVQATLGGLIATQSALLTCPSFPGCGDVSVRELASGDALNPFRRPIERYGAIVAPPGAGALHVAHRANSLAVAALVLVLAARLWRSRGELATGLGLVLCVGVGAGIAAALVPRALGITLLHDAAAALLVALLARAVALPVTAPSRPRSIERPIAAA